MYEVSATQLISKVTWSDNFPTIYMYIYLTVYTGSFFCFLFFNYFCIVYCVVLWYLLLVHFNSLAAHLEVGSVREVLDTEQQHFLFSVSVGQIKWLRKYIFEWPICLLITFFDESLLNPQHIPNKIGFTWFKTVATPRLQRLRQPFGFRSRLLFSHLPVYILQLPHDECMRKNENILSYKNTFILNSFKMGISSQ